MGEESVVEKPENLKPFSEEEFLRIVGDWNEFVEFENFSGQKADILRGLKEDPNFWIDFLKWFIGDAKKTIERAEYGYGITQEILEEEIVENQRLILNLEEFAEEKKRK